MAFADGCTGTCASGEDTSPENSRDRLGSVYYLGNGPSLYESVGNLSILIPPLGAPEPFISNHILSISFTTFAILPSLKVSRIRSLLELD